jgi:2-polyprenyl-3-methyl-5-hydroxy-6-metoxy-1,4-benzoquinol methylase
MNNLNPINLIDVVERQAEPVPWSEGEKIPWNDPDFSQRMLREHLSQKHDAASRRFEMIDRHVGWIHQHILSSRTADVLDLGCGPGLYAQRLARLGCRCTGIDFSPASIGYARAEAEKLQLDCRYLQQDIRLADFSSGHDLVMFIYGELNVFKPQETRQILTKAWQALVPGGSLLLEMSTFNSIRELGKKPGEWYTSAHGLFSEQPHFCLYESFWDENLCVTTERYFIVDAKSASVKRYASSSQAYYFEQFQQMLNECGFRDVRMFRSLTGEPGEPDEIDDGEMMVLLAYK